MVDVDEVVDDEVVVVDPSCSSLSNGLEQPGSPNPNHGRQSTRPSPSLSTLSEQRGSAGRIVVVVVGNSTVPDGMEMGTDVGTGIVTSGRVVVGPGTVVVVDVEEVVEDEVVDDEVVGVVVDGLDVVVGGTVDVLDVDDVDVLDVEEVLVEDVDEVLGVEVVVVGGSVVLVDEDVVVVEEVVVVVELVEEKAPTASMSLPTVAPV